MQTLITSSEQTTSEYMFNNLKFKIMKQNEKNSQKAQELTKEELEQVNGGGFQPRPKGILY